MICKLKVINKYFKLLFLFLFGLLKSDELIINVLNYNIHGLPKLFTNYKNEQRIPEIINKIHEYDLVLLQENWIYQDLLENSFAKNNYIIAKKNKFFKKDNPKRSSGLNILVSDKLNIYNYEEYQYENCNGWLFHANDCFASKGFIYTKILIDSDTLNVYVTHLDAGVSKKDIKIREKQLNELSNSIQKISKTEALLICGDFNIDYYSNKEKINKFINKHNLKNLKWESDMQINNKIDYIFFRGDQNAIFEIYDEGINYDLINHSDHYPIQFKILYKEK